MMILKTRLNSLHCWLQKILLVSYIQGYGIRSGCPCRNLLPICVSARELKVNFFTTSHNTEKKMAAACRYCHEMLREQPNTGRMLCLPSTVKFSCSLTNTITTFQSPNNFLQRNCRSHLSYCVKGSILIFCVLLPLTQMNWVNYSWDKMCSGFKYNHPLLKHNLYKLTKSIYTSSHTNCSF